MNECNLGLNAQMKGYCMKNCTKKHAIDVINYYCQVCNNYTTVGNTQVYSTLQQRIDIDYMVVTCFALLTVCCSAKEWAVILSHYCSTIYALFTNTIKICSSTMWHFFWIKLNQYSHSAQCSIHILCIIRMFTVKTKLLHWHITNLKNVILEKIFVGGW